MAKQAATSKKKAPVAKASAPKPVAKAPAKAAAAKKSAPPPKAAPAKKAAPTTVSTSAPAKKASPVTKADPKAAKKVPAAKEAPAKAAAPAKVPVAKKTPAAAAPAKKAAVAEPVAEAAKASAVKKALPAKKAVVPLEKGPAKPIVKPGGDFDAKFLAEQHALLLEERISLVGQAEHLEVEAAALMEDLDPGDVQFDDESGEGDSIVVERERDLALSAQARQMVAEIDAALIRLKNKTYGYSVLSGRPIPRERLQAIPWATELVEEKVGGLGSR